MSISGVLVRRLHEGEGESVMGAWVYMFFGLLGVVGRILGQLLGVRWNVRSSRRELRTSALVNAWQRLARATSRPGADLRRALADVQLFGTPVQVELAARAVRSLNEVDGERSALGELLESLRVEVRAEMGLGSVRTPFTCPTGLPRRRASEGAPARSIPAVSLLRPVDRRERRGSVLAR
jgi:hypothetical protein